MLLFVLMKALANSGLVPLPNQLQENTGHFVINEKTRWIVEEVQQKKIVDQFLNDFCIATGYHQEVKIGKRRGYPKNSILFVTNPAVVVEGYKLNVSPTTIRVEASSASGFFYSMQTLRQLLPAEINSGKLVSHMEWSMPCVTINDAPRFGYRGFMLDVSRFFMPKKDLLRLLNVLAYHKINYFHWHLVDDNGWRIEIKEYPRLTDVSAWRVDRLNTFSMRSNPEPGEAATQGGYYTQDDIREIVKYAQDRCIEVIPEIEMPAHTNAALAAYPQLACPIVDHFIGVLPGMGGKNANTIYCAGNDSVFSFLENVLSEVIQLFPSNYIHIGGDEANKENWEKCPKCQARMKANNISDEDELQSYFIKRINQFLLSKGKRLMGWDELTDSDIPKRAVIMGWRGMGLDAEKAGAQGFNYIKSPAMKYYFIRYQGPQWFEPYTYFGNTTLKDVYTYEPKSMTLPDSVSRNMLGVESCLWTEFVSSPKDAEYLIFPRLAAFAESAWTQPDKKEWTNFVQRMDKILPAYDYMGMNYALSMFNLDHEVRSTDGSVSVQLSSIRPDLEIRYTTDNTEPKNNSTLYEGVFLVQPERTIRASTFLNGIRVGAILPLNIISHKAVGATVLSKNEDAYVLTNGIRGTEKITDGEWLDFYDSDGEFVFQLEHATSCSSVEMSMLNNSGMGVHYPSEISISTSDDNVHFRLVYTKKYNEIERFQNGLFRRTELFDIGEHTFKYLKIEVKKPGNCPLNQIRSGQKCRMAFDEVIVN